VSDLLEQGESMIRRLGFGLLSVILLLSLVLTAQERPNHYEADFFPFSVWYSGGKARAPMLSDITPESREEWRRDLEQIKALGFNTVRTWVEWAKCEPTRGNIASTT
jgi:beta-galactosidase